MGLSPFYNVVLESFRSIVIFLLIRIIQFPQLISGLYILRGNHFELVYQVCSVNNRQRIHDFCIQCHLLFAVQPNVLVTGLHKNSKGCVRISCTGPLVSRLKNRKVLRRLMIHHLRCPILVHNLARPGRVILPVTEPFLEILCFRLVLRQLVPITVPGVSGGKKPVSILVKRILENSTMKFPLDNLLELC